MAQFIKGGEEISLDIIVEGLERRDINHTRVPGQPCSIHKLVDCPEKGRKGLSASGGRADQNVFTPRNEGPGLRLKRSGLPDGFGKPLLDQRMKPRGEGLRVSR
jgi:hypothetical protein